MSLFMSLIGMVVLLAIAVAFSNNRKAINLRTVGGAFAIQFALGAFVLYVPWGRDLLNGFSSGVSNVINYGNDGSSFLFGGLVSDKMFEVFGGGGFIFAFRVLPTLIFFSALISVLYYIGVMQWVIKILGGALTKSAGHFTCGINVSSSKHFRRSNRSTSSCSSIRSKNDSIRAIRGNVWWPSFCCWWCTSGLRFNGCSTRVPSSSIIHGGTRWSTIR
ncbi:membrane hypothetical protein [Vibrio diabolicus]|nr:membrane hypothetical protein [Vibrio diabolicus]